MSKGPHARLFVSDDLVGDLARFSARVLRGDSGSVINLIGLELGRSMVKPNRDAETFHMEKMKLSVSVWSSCTDNHSRINPPKNKYSLRQLT